MKMISLAIEQLLKNKLPYHNLEHTAKVCSNLFKLDEKPTTAQIYGAWFHDTIYIPGRYDNEENSVKFFFDCYKQPNFVFDAVSKIIISTKLEYHLSEINFDNYISEVMDADIAGLADENFADFTATQHAIIQEVIGKDNIISSNDKLYITIRNKQVEILKKFLNKQFIFRTPKARELWEDKARENITRWISL